MAPLPPGFTAPLLVTVPTMVPFPVSKPPAFTSTLVELKLLLELLNFSAAPGLIVVAVFTVLPPFSKAKVPSLTCTLLRLVMPPL